MQNENEQIQSGLPQLVPISEVQQWIGDMYLMIGAILHKHGRRAVDISPRELEKFAAKNAVNFKKSDDGSMRYEISKRKAGE